MTRRLRNLFTLALLSSLSVASSWTVHEHATGRREAAWQRTKCGNIKKGADIITQWGAAVTPDNVKTSFGYPRPQMTRPDATALNLNGLWEFQLAAAGDAPPFGETLAQTILVPFPLESCLSGAFTWPTYSKYMYYRLLFDAPFPSGSTLLHFGAVDWNATVYMNGALMGMHSGAYDAFSFDLTSSLKATNNELIVGVYDPSDEGYQVNGKQRLSAIDRPGGDTYTPSSGIWQSVWLENVPLALRIDKVKVRGDLTSLHVSALTTPSSASGTLSVAVSFGGAPVTTGSGPLGAELVVPIPNPRLWSPQAPNLYDVTITATSGTDTDTVGSYFGMRVVSRINATQPPVPATGPRVGMDNSGGDMPGQPTTLDAADYNLCWAACNATAGCAAWSYGVPSCGGDPNKPLCWLKASVESWSDNACRVAGDMGQPGGLSQRPAINGNFTFLAGWLDQSFWPDGEWTAPGDDALAFDVQGILAFGLNGVRLHQKVNSERWYYWADKLGVMVLQDMPQKYGGASAETVAPFMSDLAAMIDGRENHPSIIQWTAFNEGDCFSSFDVPSVVEWIQSRDPHRLVDTNSGGPANNLHIGDVNDIHSYPWPGNPAPSGTQYAMVGEFGGLGAFVPGHEWAPGECSTYLPTPTPQDEADTYAKMAAQLQAEKTRVSVSIYTQLSDVENECDGFYNMDRTNKFTPAQVAEIVAANTALINGPAGATAA